MNIETILGIVVALFGGLNIFQFIFLRITKKEYEAKAEQAQQEAKRIGVENEAKAVDTLKEVIDELRKGKDDLQEEVIKQGNLIDKLRKNYYTAALHLCLHLGCALRQPVHGKGMNVIEKKSEDSELGVDFLPINMLLKKYGEQKEEMLERATTEE